MEILLIKGEVCDQSIARYNPFIHCLEFIEIKGCIEGIQKRIAQLLDPGQGTTMIFAADMEKISSVYENPESLVWRDSGVLLGGLSLAAEAIGLAFAPLGFSGDDIVRTVLPEERFMGVGGCIVGSIC